MEKNEVIDTLQKYFHQDKGMTVHFFGNGNNPRMFANCIERGTFFPGDAPDTLLRAENTAIIIEHFEIDCSYANKKGSSSRKELNRIQKTEDQLEVTETGTYYHDEIHFQSSYELLISNVTKRFRHHYDHIEMYKNNLKNQGLISETDNVKVMFLIDDISPLGTIAIPKEDWEAKPQPVVLAQSKEFLTLMKESPDVDYVLSCSSAGTNDFVWFIDQEQLDEYFKNAQDYSSMEFLDFTPHVLGFKIAIPNDKPLAENHAAEGPDAL